MGVFSGLLFAAWVAADEPRFGVEAESIEWVSGRLSADSRLSAGGHTIYELELEEAGGKGLRAQAEGRAFFRVQNGVRGHWGDRLTVPVNISDTGFLFADGPGNLSRIDSAPAPFVHHLLAERKRLFNAALGGMALLPRAEGELFAALSLGYRDSLSADTADLFRRAGSAHVLALSGMHLGILCGAVGLFLRRLLPRLWALGLTLAFAWGYLFLAGPLPSLARAAIMLTIGGICLAFGRRVAPTSVLALSFLATTLLMPRSVHSLSFQLSFLALTGILLLSGPISTALPRAIPRLVRRGLGAALGAQLATVPLVLSSFGVVYPVGLVAGLLLAPLATGFLWAGIAATASAGAGAAVLAGTGPDPASLVLVTGSYRALLGVAEISARAPALYSGLAAVGFYATVLALIAGLGVYRAREARRLALRLPRLGGGSHGCGCPGGASHGGAL